jgi:hypothetical protein
VVYFIAMALALVAADYIAAWTSGGVVPYDWGFNGAGQLSIPKLAQATGIFTGVMVLARAWRHHRQHWAAAPAPTRPDASPLP